MLSFFKSKPILKDLLDGSFVDIHSHVLPGIDDGAQTISNSIELARSLEKIGISQIITTPHINHYVWNNSPEIIKSKLEETQNAFSENNIQTPIQSAAEYFIDDWFTEHLKEGKLLTLKDNYILVEMSYLNAPLTLYKTIFELQVAGYIPVLAHPERYTFFHKKFDEYKKLKDAGCLFQLNLLATVEYYGSKIANTADELLKKGMYDFCGTDVHHKNHIRAFDKKVKIDNIDALKEIISNNEFFRY
ncbi:tyrosine-protein phosphatase YwqE [Flavobacterium nitrogenifigens]|uniref:protein-tyrosine-phosphatase n=2 Tax=Flavobacterium TaxID=237 RepID=A0A7W7IWV1_9FLAO|nr:MULTISPECIES: CpsB/CapC family capsule biosynthesis tyrosine phosphatase [Flavobacterium]MBB4801405.1 tyrosine-protein phosphatase YwqE [Flavobacterium nitrogenifigens]MBB6386362.1 tyrosine-protein phosphatase YwqE [Flavobacterium notoginsengisoli]